MSVYYNENDRFAAAWLRELIAAGAIAKGKVDERSIKDVKAGDVKGFKQCHWFAGVGVWSYALRCAGWGDERPVWTGSCPCQPFSAAGQGKGFDDPRHLWPEWFRLIKECRPESILGEQVDKALLWLDLVSSDLENEGYACGAVDFCAASVGAPHIRQRIYWVAHPSDPRRTQTGQHGSRPSSLPSRLEQCGGDGELALTESQLDGCGDEGTRRRIEFADGGDVGDASGSRLPQRPQPENGYGAVRHEGPSAATSSPWHNCSWLPCIDGKLRPTERSFQPMADGIAADLGYIRDGDSYVLSPLIGKGSRHRVGRLRGYGNAIVAPQAEAFIRAYMETLDDNI